MTTRVTPAESALEATLAELRDRRTLLGMTATLAWCGGWAWHGWRGEGDSVGAASSVVLGVVLTAMLLDRAVRQRRGLIGNHWSMPLVVAVLTVGVLVAINSVAHVVSAGGIGFLAVGYAVVFAAFGALEQVVERRHRATGAVEAQADSAACN